MPNPIPNRSSEPAEGFNPFKPEYGFSAPTDAVDLIGLLRRSTRLLALGLGLGLLLGILAYMYLGPAYLASTKMLVSLKAALSNEQIGTRTFGDRTSHVHLIKSDFIVERAFEIGDLESLETLAPMSDPVEAVIDGLKVQRSVGTDRDYTNVFEISFQSKSKDDARQILESVIAAYNEYLAKNRSENTTEMQSLVDGKQATLRAEIEALQAEYLTFRETAPLHWTAPVGQTNNNNNQTAPPNYYVARLQEIEKDRRKAFTERAETQARIQALNKMLDSGESREAIEFFVMHAMAQRGSSEGGEGGGGGGISPTNRKETLDSELLTARAIEARLLYNLGEDHDRVTKIREKIKLILDDYRLAGLTPPNIELITSGGELPTTDLTTVYLRSLNLKLVELEFRQQELDKLYREAREDARNAATFEIKDKQYSDKLEEKKDQLQIVINQANNLDLTKESTGYASKQIAPIRVELALKRIIKIVGAFGALGMLAVLAMQYLREWQNTQLRNLDDVHRFAPAPVLGSVPSFPPVTPAEQSAAMQTGLAPTLRYFHDPGSRAAESFRSIRTTLFHSDYAEKGDRGAVIQVTSAEPGDGKSTVAGNLATAIAQSGKSVLLIDADLRRPTAHELFGARGDVGLTDVLRGDVEWPAVVQMTAIDRLSMLASGSPTDTPAEILSGSKLAEVLEQARKDYDYVILDTPPLLAVSDPCIVGPFVDGMVLVLRLFKNKRDEAERAIETVSAHGIPLVGVVVNGTAKDIDGPYYDYSPRPVTATAEPQAVDASV